MTTVKLLAVWTGWCDPCDIERPLALTAHGEHGLRAWFHGVGAEDRRLVLACEVCGQWQDVPLTEEEDPEPAATPRSALLAWTAAAAAHQVEVPAPRVSVHRVDAQVDAPTRVVDLVSHGVDRLAL